MDSKQLLDRLLAQLPDFELQRELGKGGMGIVLLGNQKKLQREVAVKFLFVGDSSEQHVLRFRREAKMYAQLAHPNLVKIWDAGVEAEFPYLVLEYIRGQDLKAALRDEPRPRLTDVAAPLAAALAYVHAQGIVHRDIKSANVMLRENGSPVLMDFGLAKKQDPNATQLTEDGTRVGTPYYMPPEVLLGKSDSGLAQDVYALGLVLYEVATGKAMSEMDKLGYGPVQRVRDGLPLIEDMGGGQAPELEALVERCLAHAPEERPTAAQLVVELDRLGLGASGIGMTLSGLPPVEAGLSTHVEIKTSQRVRRPVSGKTPVTGLRKASGSFPRTDPAGGTSEIDVRGSRLAIAGGAFAFLVAATIGAVKWRERGAAVPAASASVAAPAPASPAALPLRKVAKDGQELILIPAGFFTMGAARPMFPDEGPQHRVYLDAYYIAKTEVTNALYDRFVAETNRTPRVRFTNTDPRFDAPDHPATGVSWSDAQDYARWAGQRLPTEAEWEKAARGTDARLFPWGNEAPGKAQQCNFADSSATSELFGDDLGKAAKFQGTDGYVYTAPVGSFPRGISPFGCLEMSGNASEWVADWYDPKYYETSPSKNPTGPAQGIKKCFRGGNYDSLERSVRTCKREGELPTSKLAKIGFRTAADL